MEYKHRIKSIRERAKAINAPMTELLLAAKINPSTLHRWEQDDANPRMRSLFRALDRMEAELDGRERKLVTEIAGRSPELVHDVLDGIDERGAAA